MAMVIAATAPPRTFTASDLDTIKDDGYRREVIEGRLIVTPSPIGEHQNAAGRLFSLLDRHCVSGFKVMIAPYDWRPTGGDSLQPDLMVIRDSDYNPKGFQLATPLLVVEVRSESTAIYDATEKRSRYESLSVPAYWIVDPADPSLVALHLIDGRYVEVARVSGAEPYQAEQPYPVSIVPNELIR
ncbi:MAG: Uma2 family endonuclease [Acidimicrobiales bacterium]